MDVRMPRMTGYDACRALKASPYLKIFPSSSFLQKDRIGNPDRLEAGAEEYLLKPFAPDQTLPNE